MTDAKLFAPMEFAASMIAANIPELLQSTEEITRRKNMKKLSIDPQVVANSRAHRSGASTATIIVGNNLYVREHIPFGYRKYTTGEYVHKAYRRNFGWKNTYYQHAECTVEVPECVFSAWQSACYAKAMR